VVIPEAETEAALIEKAQRGDRSAYGEIVRRHHGGVIQVIYRMCGDAELAQDAAQDAFIRAWLNLELFRKGSSLRNWLYRIAVNAALDVLRRDAKRTSVDLDSLAMADPQEGPETALLQKERTATVQEAVLALPEASRSVLVLREYGELSYREIADALDIPLGTVMSRLNYARRLLKESLQPLFIQMEMEYD
jgi:RNA polymerase sigma-70 factor (ECF subfamily)